MSSYCKRSLNISISPHEGFNIFHIKIHDRKKDLPPTSGNLAVDNQIQNRK